MDTIDIVRIGKDVIEARERDDGFIEAIIDTSEQEEYTEEEVLVYYRPDLDLNGQPIQDLTMDKPEMFRCHKKLNIWFHSNKTLRKIASARSKRDTDEDNLEPGVREPSTTASP